MANDGLQRVVDFISDSADELPERGQFLRLREAFAECRALGLEAGAFGDIVRNQHDAGGADRLTRLSVTEKVPPSRSSSVSRTGTTSDPPASCSEVTHWQI